MRYRIATDDELWECGDEPWIVRIDGEFMVDLEEYRKGFVDGNPTRVGGYGFLPTIGLFAVAFVVLPVVFYLLPAAIMFAVARSILKV